MSQVSTNYDLTHLSVTSYNGTVCKHNCLDLDTFAQGIVSNQDNLPSLRLFCNQALLQGRSTRLFDGLVQLQQRVGHLLQPDAAPPKFHRHPHHPPSESLARVGRDSTLVPTFFPLFLLSGLMSQHWLAITLSTPLMT